MFRQSDNPPPKHEKETTRFQNQQRAKVILISPRKTKISLYPLPPRNSASTNINRHFEHRPKRRLFPLPHSQNSHRKVNPKGTTLTHQCNRNDRNNC